MSNSDNNTIKKSFIPTFNNIPCIHGDKCNLIIFPQSAIIPMRAAFLEDTDEYSQDILHKLIFTLFTDKLINFRFCQNHHENLNKGKIYKQIYSFLDNIFTVCKHYEKNKCDSEDRYNEKCKYVHNFDVLDIKIKKFIDLITPFFLDSSYDMNGNETYYAKYINDAFYNESPIVYDESDTPIKSSSQINVVAKNQNMHTNPITSASSTSASSTAASSTAASSTSKPSSISYIAKLLSKKNTSISNFLPKLNPIKVSSSEISSVQVPVVQPLISYENKDKDELVKLLAIQNTELLKLKKKYSKLLDTNNDLIYVSNEKDDQLNQMEQNLANYKINHPTINVTELKEQITSLTEKNKKYLLDSSNKITSLETKFAIIDSDKNNKINTLKLSFAQSELNLNKATDKINKMHTILSNSLNI